jgi:hypothetical protein
MFKVHLERPVTEGERRDVGNPSEAFLKLLLPEIERRLAPLTRSEQIGSRPSSQGLVR